MTELPELFDLRIKARALAFLFEAGAALAALTLILPHDASFDDARARDHRRLRRRWSGAAPVLARAAQPRVAGPGGAGRGRHADQPRQLLRARRRCYAAALHLGGAVRVLLLRHARRRSRTSPTSARRYAVVLIAIQDPPSPLIRWLLGGRHPADRRAADRRACSTALRRAGPSPRSARVELRESEAAHPARARQRAGRVRHARRRTASSAAGTARPSASSAGPRPRRSASRCATLIIPAGVPRPPRRAPPASWWTAPSADAPTHYEVELQRRDGSRFPAEATVSTAWTCAASSCSAGFIRDVTDRQRQQDEREALRARAGGAGRGRARGRDGQRHAAAGGRGARAPHARRHPVRPRDAGARRARRRRRRDLPGRRGGG